MSKREWKPGDVAMVKVKKAWHRAIRDNVAWVVITDDVNSDHLETSEGVEYDARPLVVIDPEDRELVERLIRLFWDHGTDDGDDPVAMQAALREFADPKPSKPDEPTGLGAVVIDSNDVTWVLAGRDDPMAVFDKWRAVDGPCVGDWKRWDRIDAVSVLRVGAEPLADWERDLLRGQS